MRVARGIAVVLIITAGYLSYLGGKIIYFAYADERTNADAAIVLGAAVRGDQPSPVFEQRIRHGIELYQAGNARSLIFTGGLGSGEQYAEAEVARRYALRHGVPAQAIRIETRSKTTRENLLEAQKVMQQAGLKDAILVSDPLHMARAYAMAQDLAMQVRCSPTPSTRYQSLNSKSGFFLRELYFYAYYQITGH